MKVLVTCPPMLGMIDSFRPRFDRADVEIVTPKVVQTLSVPELKELIPDCDGWIIGDDPATREVFAAGRAGCLRAAVKWGVGVDNIDFDACAELGIPIANTPDMFGAEVADVAVGYVIGLARETYEIDRRVRAGEWPKLRGISLSGKTAALIGFGNVGSSIAKRLVAMEMEILVYDPGIGKRSIRKGVRLEEWPNRLADADFIVVSCSLNSSSYHMINSSILNMTKVGVRIVNVGRGPVIDETALIAAMECERVYSVALDVFEVEPLPMGSYLRQHPRCILGSHNASNTRDAVERTSHTAITKLFDFLKISR